MSSIFFKKSSRILQQINATFISLIPKKLEVESFDDYQPLALCNLIYKFITKILANWLKPVMILLVRLNQTAFIEGRFIVENILACCEVVRGFERKNHSSASIMKIDLIKAYDSLFWEFIHETLVRMKFLEQFIGWVMECITSPRFSIMLNGSPTGFFLSTCGLQQDDLISPLLFCLTMEVLYSLLEK